MDFLSIVDTTGFAPGENPLYAISTGFPAVSEIASQNPGASMSDIIGQALSIYQMDRQQRAFLETNRELIAQGRSPIAWDQFQPTASVGVSVDSNTQKLIWALGIGALVIGFLAVMRK